ncbi:MAG TPA: aminotransferase class I/II-fold pyridoxal phosphate-dependent enzyme [Candidatus Kapabacteria bacterium]|nr:aminotransferase class I/II-fold pyridoxal phosphate-dependent enzyme [Candidatus Kapabacteria bacterium]
MDLFKKAYDFTRADDVKKAGYYPYFHAFEANEGPVVYLDGRKIIMAGSNNYLGLTIDPRVKEAAKKAIDQYGTGCSGSRYLTGTIKLHNQLEEELADFFGKQACLLFSTGYQTAQGVIPTLCQRGDYVISDKDNHACIVAGQLMSKGMYGEVVRYAHNDYHDLERRLSKLPLDAGKLIVSDGIFSTTGELVDLPHIISLAKKYNARVMMDDAHASGVIGEGGRGTASHFNLVDECDLTMGTFSKTFASLGGFVTGEERVINFIKHTSPALIFSASPTPASVASALEALRILIKEPERKDKLLANANYMRQGFKQLGFEIIENQSAIVPVIVGDDIKAFVFWKKLFDAGVFVNAFISPGVPEGMQMMRTSYMAVHEREHLDRILELFKEIGEEVGVLDADDETVAAETTRVALGEYKSQGKITISEASSRKEKLRFVRLVWDLYSEEKNWVPPLEMDKMRLINEKRNPFYKHAEAKFFIAEDDGKPVGRIAAIINHSHNKLYNDKIGFFGFFECVNNQSIADTLFKKAEEWLASKGMRQVRGPISPSINDEVGLLVEGYDIPAAFMMPYHLPYYKTLIEHAGYAKAKDVLAWKLDKDKTLTPKLKRVTDVLRERGGFTVRSLDMKHFDRDVNIIKDLYAKGWEENWGAVPLNDEEINMLAGELKQVIEPNYVLFAEKKMPDGKNEVVGFTLTLPDINQAFLAGSPIPKGALNLPVAIKNLMTNSKAIKGVRIILLGVLPQYHGRGVDALMYRETLEQATNDGKDWGEASWVLEDNDAMNRAAKAMDADAYKRYRIFEKNI